MLFTRMIAYLCISMYLYHNNVIAQMYFFKFNFFLIYRKWCEICIKCNRIDKRLCLRFTRNRIITIFFFNSYIKYFASSFNGVRAFGFDGTCREDATGDGSGRISIRNLSRHPVSQSENLRSSSAIFRSVASRFQSRALRSSRGSPRSGTKSGLLLHKLTESVSEISAGSPRQIHTRVHLRVM